MAGLSDAFRMPAQWPPQPRMADPMMPVPQMQQAPLDLGALLENPIYRQQEPQQQGFAISPGFADFLRRYYGGT